MKWQPCDTGEKSENGQCVVWEDEPGVWDAHCNMIIGGIVCAVSPMPDEVFRTADEAKAWYERAVEEGNQQRLRRVLRLALCDTKRLEAEK